ncbi:hypothetical protein [Bdellovibrio sp. HCB-110]|uniref:hypothetical protein n=1 Tax=Bdellovibrio sp. HCB-110 TaxID=3391182 RepID=UPI0039B39115
MKIIIATLCSFFALAAPAQVNETVIQCTRNSKSTCADRTLAAFEKLGCNPLPQSVQCQDAATDPLVDPSEVDNVRGKDFCVVQSDCHEPNYGNFGKVSCSHGEQVVNLRSVDGGITLTTSVGFFRRYVTSLCKLFGLP